jgi:DhnA family fructose-bisphosphate aldolase class Ia
MGPEGRPAFVALDHGMSMGAVAGLAGDGALARVVAVAARAGATGVVLHRGMLGRVAHVACPPLILQTMGLPARWGTSGAKVAVATVEQALTAGAAAISVQLDFGAVDQRDTVREAAALTGEAQRHGLVVLAMVAPREWSGADELIGAARVCAELGADLVKIGPGGLDREPLVPALGDAGVPLLMPGGAADVDLASRLRWGAEAGYAGPCVGRGIFASDAPEAALRAARTAFALVPAAPGG